MVPYISHPTISAGALGFSDIANEYAENEDHSWFPCFSSFQEPPPFSNYPISFNCPVNMRRPEKEVKNAQKLRDANQFTCMIFINFLNFKYILTQ
jgi:hypothetical protein